MLIESRVVFFGIPSRRNLSLTSLLFNSVAGRRPVLDRGKSVTSVAILRHSLIGVNWLPFTVAEVSKPPRRAGLGI